MGKTRLNPNIFFEGDSIKVAAVEGETVTIAVKRNRHRFSTQVKKSDFSQADQARFTAVAVDVRLRRSNGYFSVA